MVREDLINVIVVGLVNSPPLSSARSHVSPACRARQYIAESRSSQAELIFRGLSDGISLRCRCRSHLSSTCQQQMQRGKQGGNGHVTSECQPPLRPRGGGG